MDEARARRYEELLLRERDRALQALHRIDEEEAEPQSASAGDTVRSSKTFADSASETQEQEADFLSATRLSRRLADLDAALDLLGRTPDRFGICGECGEAIEPDRLELVPWSPLCGSCVRVGEQTGAG